MLMKCKITESGFLNLKACTLIELRQQDTGLRLIILLNQTLNQLINALKLPKLELKVFDGNPVNYPSFLSIFDEAVNCKVKDNQVKLTRLLQYTSGSAYSAIKNSRY